MSVTGLMSTLAMQVLHPYNHSHPIVDTRLSFVCPPVCSSVEFVLPPLNSEKFLEDRKIEKQKKTSDKGKSFLQ